MEGKRKWRWGILGTSFISDIMISAIQESHESEVYCLSGRTPNSVNALGDKYGITVRYLSYEEVLSDPLVEIIYIGLPTYLHGDWMKKCAAAGKHILCEKSFTINSSQAEDVINHLTSSNVFCLEAQMYRFHPIIPRLKETIHQMPLGRVLRVQGTFTAPILDLFNRIAGGSILDLGCYPISLTRYLFGEPTSVRGTSTIFTAVGIGQNNFDIDSTAYLDLPNDITATITARNNQELSWEYVVICENGTIQLSNLWDNSVDHAITMTSSISHDFSSQIVLNPPKSFYTLQIEAVVEAIKDGKCQIDPPGMTWADSLNNMRVLDAWRDAIGLKYPFDS